MVSVEIMCEFPKVSWKQWKAIFTLTLIPNARIFFRIFREVPPTWTSIPLSIEIVILWGGAFLSFVSVYFLKRTYFQPCSIIILICVVCIIFLWNLNLLYIIYHLIHSVTLFLHTFQIQSMRILAWLLNEPFYYQNIVQS